MISLDKLVGFEEHVGEAFLDALDDVPPERRDAATYPQAVGLLAHVVAAEILWVARLVPEAEIDVPEVFPDWDLATIRENASLSRARWRLYLSTVDLEREATRRVHYTNTSGQAFTDEAQDLWLHVYGHGLHHRGQIASLLRGLGQAPPRGDLIFYLRTLDEVGG